MFIILHGAVHTGMSIQKNIPTNSAERACIYQLEQQHQVKQTFTGQYI